MVITMQVEFVKAKNVEAGRLTLWWRGDYTYELEIRRACMVVWSIMLEDCDQEAAEEEFARIS